MSSLNAELFKNIESKTEVKQRTKTELISLLVEAQLAKLTPDERKMTKEQIAENMNSHVNPKLLAEFKREIGLVTEAMAPEECAYYVQKYLSILLLTVSDKNEVDDICQGLDKLSQDDMKRHCLHLCVQAELIEHASIAGAMGLLSSVLGVAK